MSVAFNNALSFLLSEEGGYSCDALDPGNWTGGAVNKGKLNGTKWGVSAASYPTLDIKNLTIIQVSAIYQTRYWRPIAGDSLPPALSLVVFDSSVNQGPKTAIRFLQRALAIREDGVCGPITTLAAQATKDVPNLIAMFSAFRALDYAQDSNFDLYGDAWMRRTMRSVIRSLTPTVTVSLPQ